MNKKLIGILAIIANFILSVGKVLVGIISNSAAILADGINSATDVFASFVGYIGIIKSEKPADKKHPYGHTKAEVVSGFLITLIIFLSALYILYEGFYSFFDSSVITLGTLGFAVMGISALTNFIMSRLKIHYGKKYDSVSLISDGVHSNIDFLVSLGIFLGLFLTSFYSKIDSILAILVGFYIIKESISLLKESLDPLLDASAGEEIEEKIKGIIKKEKIEVSEIKTQKKGSIITANIEIKLPKDKNVEEATKISEALKKNLIDNIKSLEYVAIQIKSHDFTSSYFQPKDIISKFISSKEGYQWQRRGRFKSELSSAEAKGPEGNCVCSKCGYKQKHEKGKPCSKTKCPKCHAIMKRE